MMSSNAISCTYIVHELAFTWYGSESTKLKLLYEPMFLFNSASTVYEKALPRETPKACHRRSMGYSSPCRCNLGSISIRNHQQPSYQPSQGFAR